MLRQLHNCWLQATIHNSLLLLMQCTVFAWCCAANAPHQTFKLYHLLVEKLQKQNSNLLPHCYLVDKETRQILLYYISNGSQRPVFMLNVVSFGIFAFFPAQTSRKATTKMYHYLSDGLHVYFLTRQVYIVLISHAVNQLLGRMRDHFPNSTFN